MVGRFLVDVRTADLKVCGGSMGAGGDWDVVVQCGEKFIITISS